MAEILKLVNDTDEVNLLDTNSIYVIGWEPSFPAEREIVTFSQYDNGSTLLAQQYENIVETMTLYIVGTTQDQVLSNLRNLRSILRKGVSYYTGLTTTPTYLVVKSNNETNTRYAVVKKFKIDKIPQVLGSSPFNTGAISGGITFGSALVTINLALELSLYRSQPPGSYETALISGTGQFNSVTYGNVNSSQGETPVSETYIASKYNEANISHVFVFDASAASFSSNQAAAALPWNLLPSPVAVNDILYVGIQTSLTDSGHFSNLIFDVSATRTLPISGNWEFWNGAWTVDRSGTLGGTGTLSGVWQVNFGTYRSTEVTTAVNGVTGYWRRFIVTSINGDSTTIQQQNRRVYSVTWPYVKIDEDQVAGDEPCLLKLKITPRGETGLAEVDRLIIGLRSMDRGSTFNAYINLSDEQVDDSLSVSVSGLDGTFVSYLESPTGRAIRLNEAGPNLAYSVAEISASAATSSYSGRFRAFLVVRPVTVSAVSDVQFYLEIYNSLGQTLPTFTTPRKSLSSTTAAISVVDLGEINTSPRDKNNLTTRLRIIIKGYVSTVSTIDIYSLCLILIPADEWSCDLVAPTDPVSAAMYLEVDSTSPPETGAAVRNTADDSFEVTIVPNMAVSPRLQYGGDQKLWFLIIDDNPFFDPRKLLKIEVFPVYQYLTPRGDV